MHWWGDSWAMWWTMLWPIALLLILLWALLAKPGTTVREGEPPDVILKQRYAGGEMDRGEYERRLADLRKGRAGGKR